MRAEKLWPAYCGACDCGAPQRREGWKHKTRVYTGHFKESYLALRRAPQPLFPRLSPKVSPRAVLSVHG